MESLPTQQQEMTSPLNVNASKKLPTMESGQLQSNQNINISSVENISIADKDQDQGDEERNYNLCFIIQLVSIAAIGGFLFGYDTGVISGAQLYFHDDWPDITTEQRSLVVSIATLGAAFGSLLSGPISDRIGRKKVIMVADVLFTFGAIVMAISPTIGILMVGRVIVGLGVGIAAQVVPVYLAEVSPDLIRGRVVSFNVLMITLGQFISCCLVLLFRPNWRLMLGLAGVPSFLQLVGMIFMPESPRWLGKKEEKEQVRQVLTKIYKEDQVDYQCLLLEKEVVKLQQETQLSQMDQYKQLFTTYGRCLFIGCGLQFWQQFVGINTAMYYGPDILIATGFKLNGYTEDETGIILNLPLAFTNAVGTVIALAFIDRLGRRYIMLRFLPMCTVAMFTVATGMYLVYYTDVKETVGQYLAFGGIIFYLLMFSIGMATPPWTVNSEIYPLHLIGSGTSLSTFTNWISNFVVASVFLIFLDNDENNAGKVYAFVILGIFGLMAWVFVYYLVPETANKSIQEILKAILGNRYQMMQEDADAEKQTISMETLAENRDNAPNNSDRVKEAEDPVDTFDN